jgi:hypothetical protein
LDVTMNPVCNARGAALLAVAAAMAGLAACGHTAPPPGSAAPAPSAAAHATTAPAAKPSATPVPGGRPSATAPAEKVLSYRVSYPWHWPNDAGSPGSVGHSAQVPPMPKLIAISAGDHPRDSGEKYPYNRLSFTFTRGFPSYRFSFADALVSDPGGRTIPLAGMGVLQVAFHQAQAHTAGGGSTVGSQPPEHLGYTRMVAWAPAGDFEGVLTYGIGVDWPIHHSNPQFPVRTVEVEKVTSQGQHLYIVAIDINAGSHN